MADPASPQLIWHLIRGNNAFIKKNLQNTWFSTEPGNLCGKHNYKYSGIANRKTVDIQIADEEEGRALTLTKKTKKAPNQPKAAFATVTMKKPLSRLQKSVAKEVGGYRPDLKDMAVSRVCNVHAATRRAAKASA